MSDPLDALTDVELDFLVQNLDAFEDTDALELDSVLDVIEKRKSARSCREDLIEFCKKMHKVQSNCGSIAKIHERCS